MSHPRNDKGQGKDVFERCLPWGRGYGGDIYPMAVNNRRVLPQKNDRLELVWRVFLGRLGWFLFP